MSSPPHADMCVVEEVLSLALDEEGCREGAVGLVGGWEVGRTLSDLGEVECPRGVPCHLQSPWQRQTRLPPYFRPCSHSDTSPRPSRRARRFRVAQDAIGNAVHAHRDALDPPPLVCMWHAARPFGTPHASDFISQNSGRKKPHRRGSRANMAPTYVLKFQLADNSDAAILAHATPKGGNNLDLDLLATDGDAAFRGKGESFWRCVLDICS